MRVRQDSVLMSLWSSYARLFSTCCTYPLRCVLQARRQALAGSCPFWTSSGATTALVAWQAHIQGSAAAAADCLTLVWERVIYNMHASNLLHTYAVCVLQARLAALA
jgi:hypothetical protein